MFLYPLLFGPNLHETVWGGTRLREWKNMAADGKPIGESWEVSAIPGSESVIANGSFAGRKLSDFTEELGERVLGRSIVEKYGRQLPLLIKFIDAQQDLSIQVHPNDEMALKYHNKKGKTEMWYVIDAKPGSSLLAGFKQSITPDEYCRRVEDGTICDVLARHEVKAGDVFFIPAGRVHAICGGILLAEVQQSSDVTYRIFDYNRPGIDGKPRELHTQLAAEAINYQVLSDYRTHYSQAPDQAIPVIECPFFNINVMNLSRPLQRNMKQYDSFVISICMNGACTIEVNGQEESTKVELKAGQSCLIPAEIADYTVIPATGGTKILETFINEQS